MQRKQFVTIPWDSELYKNEVQLRDQLLRAPLGLAFSAEQLAAEQDELHFGVIDDNALVACVVVVPKTNRLAKVRQMAVRPQNQKSGIGRFLVGKVEDNLRERGFQQIELNARVAAMGFYERLGYQIVGDEFIEVSIPHMKMTKAIA